MMLMRRFGLDFIVMMAALYSWHFDGRATCDLRFAIWEHFIEVDMNCIHERGHDEQRP